MTINQHQIGVAVQIGGSIAEIDLPAQVVNHPLPRIRITLIAGNDPAMPPVAMHFCFVGNGDNAVQVILLQQRVYDLRQFLLVPIPLPSSFGRLCQLIQCCIQSLACTFSFGSHAFLQSHRFVHQHTLYPGKGRARLRVRCSFFSFPSIDLSNRFDFARAFIRLLDCLPLLFLRQGRF